MTDPPSQYLNTITGLPSNYHTLQPPSPSSIPSSNAGIIHAQQQELNSSGWNEVPKYRPPKQTKMQEFIRTKRGKLMVFIDGSNLLYTAQSMALDVDYLRLVDVLVGRDDLIRVNFYAGIDNDNQASVGWQTFMNRTGFRMVTKQVVSYSDGKQKANCDVEMAVDMINLSDSFDTAVLVTGDGDLTYAVNCLMNKGKQVEVYGARFNTAEKLINTADRFIDLESIRGMIQKKHNFRNE